MPASMDLQIQSASISAGSRPCAHELPLLTEDLRIPACEDVGVHEGVSLHGQTHI